MYISKTLPGARVLLPAALLEPNIPATAMGQLQKYYLKSDDWRLLGAKQPSDSARHHQLSKARNGQNVGAIFDDYLLLAIGAIDKFDNRTPGICCPDHRAVE